MWFSSFPLEKICTCSRFSFICIAYALCEFSTALWSYRRFDVDAGSGHHIALTALFALYKEAVTNKLQSFQNRFVASDRLWRDLKKVLILHKRSRNILISSSWSHHFLPLAHHLLEFPLAGLLGPFWRPNIDLHTCILIQRVQIG